MENLIEFNQTIVDRISCQTIQVPKELMEGMKWSDKIPDVVSLGWIAGGAVRRWFHNGERLSDVDVFFKDEKSFKDYIGLLENKGSQKLSEHENAVTYTCDETRVQCIRINYYPTVEHLFDSFDFTLCQFAWDGFRVYATPEAIISVLRGRLGVHKIHKKYAVDSLRRAFKYAKKGFLPCSGTLQAIANSLSGLTEVEIKQAIEISPGGGQRTRRID